MQEFLDQGAGRFGAARDRGHIHHGKSIALAGSHRSPIRTGGKAVLGCTAYAGKFQIACTAFHMVM
jgi:hypothetical protein